jgi:predicted dehydrogenase
LTLRVGVIGARRVRQGLGPFVARHLAELGARVPCFLASRAESVPETERALSARGYTDLRRMLADEKLDALAILSPSETHERYLHAALEAGLHALCEKPLLWGGTGLAARASALERGFRAAGLGLRECCQWPYTLPAYRALHPEADAGPVRSFAMRLSPASFEPRAMLADSLPHPLSLLQALVPGPARIAGIRFESPARGSLRLAFEWHGAAAAPVAVEIALETKERPPREAAVAVNGRRAERRIRPADYALFFADGAREVPVPDPLRALLADFVAEPARAPTGESGERMALLEGILDALPPGGGA